VRLLLDTHAYVWFTLDEPGLSDHARSHIRSVRNEKFVSAASYWEIAIKISKGQYQLSTGFESFWRRTTLDNEINILPIGLAHAERVIDLPHHHKAPFDRMIVPQALSEQMTLISADAQLDAYGVPRIG
jgi:PIN domain nuclease of toxin-antitoxin system